MHDILERAAAAREGAAERRLVRRAVADSDDADRRVLFRNREHRLQLVLTPDAVEEGIEALVCRREQEQHHRGPGVDVPEGDVPEVVVAHVGAHALLVRLSIAPAVNLRVGAHHDVHGRGSEALVHAPADRRDSRQLNAALRLRDDDELDALAVAGARAAPRGAQDTIDGVTSDRLLGEGADHAAPADRLLEFHGDSIVGALAWHLATVHRERTQAKENETVTKQGDLALLKDPIVEMLLASANLARLAYNWFDGTPRVVPIWFHWDGQEIVLGTPPKAPKIKALQKHPEVALTIDSDTAWPYKVLLVRGHAQVEMVQGIGPEYAASARRYFGEEQGSAWVEQIKSMVSEMARIAVRPRWVGVLDFETRFPSALSG